MAVIVLEEKASKKERTDILEVRQDGQGYFRSFGFKGEPTRASVRGYGELVFQVEITYAKEPGEAPHLYKLIDKAVIRANEMGIKVPGVNISRPEFK